MSGDEFMRLYKNTELRQRIIQCAKEYSRKPEVQEDFVQEAWMWLGVAPAGYSLEAYMEVVRSAIYCEYWKERKDRYAKEAYYWDLASCMNGR